MGAAREGRAFHPHPSPLPSRERGFNCDVKDGSGVLCFSLGSRLRGNDGGWREGWRGDG